MTTDTTPTLGELLERNDERRREARAAFVKARAELTILERFDDHRKYAYGDYGGGQRVGELTRRRREVASLRARADLGVGALLAEPTRLELVAAFDRVARPKVKRLIRDMGRCGRTRSSGATLKAWRCVAAELELRIDNPVGR